ncbi:uncharacterized protein LOC127712355 [Mytilus californianus]|uniref:uncharacterized protein LOC127712355 n=1 Tax=Mytilus californianus TaxID=6549 RepID=UPI00224590BA|nr:uncharacterized protein LOC127712355 [Mytilus californianus]
MKTFHIISDGHHIDPSCSLYFIGVNNINSTYSFSGMCFKMSDIALPCSRNNTLIFRGWALDIRHRNQSILLYANQSMLITEKTLRCDNKQDFTISYEFCWEEIFMLEILFYSQNKPSSVLPTINVQSRVLIGSKYPALSLHDLETMTIQMDECRCSNVPNCRKCIATLHQMYLDFLRILIGNNKNNNNNNNGKDAIKEESSSASVDLNILLPTLFGSIVTIVVAVIGVKSNSERKRAADNGSQQTNDTQRRRSADNGSQQTNDTRNGRQQDQRTYTVNCRKLKQESGYNMECVGFEKKSVLI